MSDEIEVLLAEPAIQPVLTTYSRGVDRYDFERVRDCYWPDGTDDHGSFVGTVDDFIVHRYTDTEGQPTDMWAGLRYVDRFESRNGEWRIRARVCAYEWRRTDRVDGQGGFAKGHVRGVRSTDDIVYRILQD